MFDSFAVNNVLDVHVVASPFENDYRCRLAFLQLVI
jgi:hypothetical protein